MNNIKSKNLHDEIKNLRSRNGCLKNINNARELTKIMGCTDDSKKYKTSCLLILINEFCNYINAEALEIDLLLLGLNLLKGYEKSTSTNKRRSQYNQKSNPHTHQAKSSSYSACSKSLKAFAQPLCPSPFFPLYKANTSYSKKPHIKQ